MTNLGNNRYIHKESKNVYGTVRKESEGNGSFSTKIKHKKNRKDPHLSAGALSVVVL